MIPFDFSIEIFSNDFYDHPKVKLRFGFYGIATAKERRELFHDLWSHLEKLPKEYNSSQFPDVILKTTADYHEITYQCKEQIRQKAIPLQMKLIEHHAEAWRICLEKRDLIK